jgi:hypothetical protein
MTMMKTRMDAQNMKFLGEPRVDRRSTKTPVYLASTWDKQNFGSNMEPPHKKQKASSGAMAYARIMKDFAQQGLHPEECDVDCTGLKYENTTVSVVLIVANTSNGCGIPSGLLAHHQACWGSRQVYDIPARSRRQGLQIDNVHMHSWMEFNHSIFARSVRADMATCKGAEGKLRENRLLHFEGHWW